MQSSSVFRNANIMQTHKEETVAGKESRNNISKINSSSPLISLRRSVFNDDIRCMILAKILHRGVTGSPKDELAKCMLDEVEKSGDVTSDTVLISYSSGNFSISLANAAIEKKYKIISILPFCTSEEKLSYLRAMGSKIVLVPDSSTDSNLNSCNLSIELISMAHKIQKEIPNSYLIHPYEDYFKYFNSLAAEIYYEEIAGNIISQCDGRLDICVCGTETLGMITKLSEKIKEIFPQCKVVGIKTIRSTLAADLSDSSSSSKLWTASEIEDLEYPNNLHSPNVELESIDDWITIEDKKSFSTYLELLESDGLLTGKSSGALLAGTIEAINKYGLKDEKEAKVVVIFQEPFEYTNVNFLNKNFMIEKNYMLNADFSKKKWWWGVFIGNLRMKAPPIVTKDSVIGKVIKKIGTQNGVVMDKENILGIVTPELSIIVDAMEENSIDIYRKIISDVPGCCCTDFRVINHSNKTLGDVSLLLKECTHLIITGSTELVTSENKGMGMKQGKDIVTIVGVLTNMDILRYITKVEGHHRKQSNWDVKTNTLITKNLPSEP